MTSQEPAPLVEDIHAALGRTKDPRRLSEQLQELRAQYAGEIATIQPPKYERTSRIRHWWESKKGEWRNRLRAWLGIEELDECTVDLGAHVGRAQDAFEWLKPQVETLRTDFDTATQATVDIHRIVQDDLKKLDRTMGTLVGQLNQNTGEIAKIRRKHRAWEATNTGLRKVSQGLEARDQRMARHLAAQHAAVSEPTPEPEPPADHIKPQHDLHG